MRFSLIPCPWARTIIACLLLGVEATAGNLASYPVKGVVLDNKGTALPLATVRVRGTNIGVGTNTRGEFTLDLKRGEHVLVASFVGFEPRELTVQAGEEETVTFRLRPATNDLDEVVVTGSRAERPLKDVPVITRVITSEEIKRLNPLDFQSLLEYELPGVQFGRHHGTGLPTLTFQGMDANYVLFLVDGERVAGEGAADNIDFNRFNIDDIERVEIVRGAMSTLYGSNALGGVVNIITKSVNRRLSGSLSGVYTSRGEQKYALSLGSKLKKFSTLTSASYRLKKPFSIEDKQGTTTVYETAGGQDSIVMGQPGSTAITGYNIWHLNEKLAYNVNEKLSVTATGSYYTYRRVYLASLNNKKEDLSREYSAGGKVKYIFNENNIVEFNYHRDHFDKYIDYILTGREEHTYRDVLDNFRLAYSLSIREKHYIVTGIELDNERLMHYMFKDTAANSVRNGVFYLQEEYRILDNLRIVAGARLDYHSEYNLHVSPKLSVMYRPGVVTLRGGYSTGFRSPSLKELYSEWDHQGMFTLLGNRDLKPEESRQFSLSAEVNKGIFNLSASGYVNRFKRKIVLQDVRENGEWFMKNVNSDRARTTGADITAQARFPFGLHLRSSYAYVDDHDEIDGRDRSSVRPRSATFSAAYSRNIGKTRASASLNGRWMCAVDVWSLDTATGRYFYQKHSARNNWRLNLAGDFPRGIRLTAGIDNLFNFTDKNVSGDTYASLSRGIDYMLALSIKI
ncbi:MAG: TonB-dependent receptor [Odoribacteraceae bacterium]|jgi:outer membrane receptor for ferrienterochelin and colicins|nr:TonB-dependent receptor [Odoribacteraceae bacterium]